MTEQLQQLIKQFLEDNNYYVREVVIDGDLSKEIIDTTILIRAMKK